MAIRPADLQLAYLAAPQNAALVSAAQEAPQAAQAAAQTTFAAQVQQREETIKGTEHGERTSLRTNPDGSNDGSGYTPQQRQRARDEDSAQDSPLGLSGEGEHFIDFTA